MLLFPQEGCIGYPGELLVQGMPLRLIPESFNQPHKFLIVVRITLSFSLLQTPRNRFVLMMHRPRTKVLNSL